MEFGIDINKLEKMSLSKNKKLELNLTEKEVKFMRYIYNTIVESDNYDTTIQYLAGIYNVSKSSIKFIKNVYFYNFASKDEKIVYVNKNKELKKKRTKEGFIDVSAMISITIFISVFGITLALFLYNLL